MARNTEKAQAMLYRFREKSAIEADAGGRVAGGRRPRVAASVSSLRECERWRGDIMKDISRKVSKIQDSFLTDYEVRDLNDEINQLLREKRHWETQIVNLGGANYKRAQSSMTDDQGKEVPGTRGYKYFGRARELPGVKEMFQKSAVQATEESARNASFQMFRNQGPEYYGDADELDADLVKEEDEAAREDWDTAAAEAAGILSVPEETALPPYPEARLPQAPEAGAESSSKRKSPEPEEEEEKTTKKGKKAAKKGGKQGNGDNVPPPPPPGGPDNAAQAVQSAFASAFGGAFDAAMLNPPAQPDPDALGKILLERRKTALREEYGV